MGLTLTNKEALIRQTDIGEANRLKYYGPKQAFYRFLAFTLYPGLLVKLQSIQQS